MAKVKLSILIPITPERFETVQPLLSLLGYTIGLSNFMNHGTWIKRWANEETYETELVIYNDNKEITLGEKREALYREANGLYSFQIDSDDSIAPDAIEKILAAINENPDVDAISFEERCLINDVEYRSRFSNEYADWEGEGNVLLSDGFHFHRTIFYKCVVKTELAKQVPFKWVRFGEDHEWAKDLKPLIQTEYHIPEQLYHYIHNSKPQDFNERYGFNKS